MSDNSTEDGGFAVTRASTGSAIVLSLLGEADVSTVEVARRALNEALSERDSLVVLDLAQLTFVDSTSLSVWITALQLAKETNCELRIAAAKGLVNEVLTIAGLKELFLITQTLQEALDIPRTPLDT